MTEAKYVVIFSSKQVMNSEGYEIAAARIAERVQAMPGFIRMENVHDTSRKWHHHLLLGKPPGNQCLEARY